jgi:PKHD-type hydroxylase
MNPQKYFEDNRYVYLENVISKSDCKALTDHMFSLYENGKTEKDPQCLLSDSIYGDPLFDTILERLAEPLSNTIGIELIPTYTYARIYRPGEILKKHIDRESCEISGTMTLGFDPNSSIWPIHFTLDEQDEEGKNAIIEVGDLLLYRGNELHHWRPKYKGEWQVQIFFHYVDKNGPHAEWAYDKRKSLKIINPSKENLANNSFGMKNYIHTSGIMIQSSDDIFPGGITYPENNPDGHFFTHKECDDIVNIASKKYPVKAKIGHEKGGTYNSKTREVDLYDIQLSEKTLWIFEKIAKAVGHANIEYFKFDLLGITHSLQLLHYKSETNGHYDWHVDIGGHQTSTRKISVSIPLNDNSEYEGGELEIDAFGEIVTMHQGKGTITLFPSFMSHRVKPVTKGERWALVVWVHGTSRFR